MAKQHRNRAPLRAIILAKTGEDIRRCTRCWHCDLERTESMDLSFGEIIRAALEDSPTALDNDTLWNCDPAIEHNPICPSGLDRSIVLQAMREEAVLRGYERGS